MKKTSAKKLKLNKIIIARLNANKSGFIHEPADDDSTHPNCGTVKPPTAKTVVGGFTFF